MVISQALINAAHTLRLSGITSCAEDARVIMCSVLDCGKLYLTVHRDEELPSDAERRFSALIQRRAKHEPVSYLTNCREFMSLEFYVDKNVLIPRPDTEILVEKVLALFSDRTASVLDMCTGSGAVAVSLAKYMPLSRVTGLDISADAVKTAEKNASSNGVADRCTFEIFDVREPYCGTFDVLTANPPYIPTADIADLDSDVKDFEPHLALDGGADGMSFYEKIIKNAPSCLKEGGFAAFEVGCGLAEKVRVLMEENFEKTEIIPDLAGIDRVVCGYLR